MDCVEPTNGRLYRDCVEPTDGRFYRDCVEPTNGRLYQPMWWPPLMSRLDPVIHEASSLTRKATA